MKPFRSLPFSFSFNMEQENQVEVDRALEFKKSEAGDFTLTINVWAKNEQQALKRGKQVISYIQKKTQPGNSAAW